MRYRPLLYRGVLLGILLFACITVFSNDQPMPESMLTRPSDAAAPGPSVVGARPGIPHRTEVVPGDATEDSQPPQRNFDSIYRDLIEHFTTARARDTGPEDPDRAAELFAEMVTVEPRAGERALCVLAGLDSPWNAPNTVIPRDVCRLLLDFNLQQLSAVAELAQYRAPLVHAMISQMPIAEDAATLVCGLLADRPYLEAEHEPKLVELALAGQHSLRFLCEPVRRLLVTVWNNVGHDRQIHASLLEYLEGEPGTLRDAAIDRLLLDDRYRTLIVNRLVLARDTGAMVRAALLASRKLPFSAAIEVLATLKSAAPTTHFGGAYATLAENAPAELVRHYQQRLADLAQPAHREQLVLALGNYARDQGGAEIALLAFRNDPDVRTRGVALLAIAAADDASLYCQCLSEALAMVGDDAVLFDYIAASLINGAQRCEVNWLDAATQQVLAMGRLSDRRRSQLLELRSQYLPK